MQAFADFELSSLLSDIVKAAIERGEWGFVEIGFFDELGEYIMAGVTRSTDNGGEAVS